MAPKAVPRGIAQKAKLKRARAKARSAGGDDDSTADGGAAEEDGSAAAGAGGSSGGGGGSERAENMTDIRLMDGREDVLRCWRSLAADEKRDVLDITVPEVAHQLGVVPSQLQFDELAAAAGAAAHAEALRKKADAASANAAAAAATAAAREKEEKSFGLNAETREKLSAVITNHEFMTAIRSSFDNALLNHGLMQIPGDNQLMRALVVVMESHLTLIYTRKSLLARLAIFVIFWVWTSYYSFPLLTAGAVTTTAAAAQNSTATTNTTATAAAAAAADSDLSASGWLETVSGFVPVSAIWLLLRAAVCAVLGFLLLTDGDAFASPEKASPPPANPYAARAIRALNWFRRRRHLVLVMTEDDPKSAHPQSTLNACSRMDGRLTALMVGMLLIRWSDWAPLFPVCCVTAIVPLIVIQIENVVKPTDENALRYVRRFFLLLSELFLLYFAWFRWVYFVFVAFFFLPNASCVILSTAALIGAQAGAYLAAIQLRVLGERFHRSWKLWGCWLASIVLLWWTADPHTNDSTLVWLFNWCCVIGLAPAPIVGLSIKANFAVGTVFSSASVGPLIWGFAKLAGLLLFAGVVVVWTRYIAPRVVRYCSVLDFCFCRLCSRTASEPQPQPQPEAEAGAEAGAGSAEAAASGTGEVKCAKCRAVKSKCTCDSADAMS